MNGINISNNSETPIYQQLFEQISSSIIIGELPADYHLPPIRTAARELRVSIITVKKAWEELEREGLIYTNVGRGCFVANLSQDVRENKKVEILKKQMEKDILFYKNYNVTKNEMIKLLDQVLIETK